MGRSRSWQSRFMKPGGHRHFLASVVKDVEAPRDANDDVFGRQNDEGILTEADQPRVFAREAGDLACLLEGRLCFLRGERDCG